MSQLNSGQSPSPGHDWGSTLRWLVEKGLPAHAPTAMRALRSEHAEVPPELLSRAEAQSLAQLRKLEEEYESARRVAVDKLEAARALAVPIGDALLFEQGPALESAVAAVLRSAGLDVLDLDAEFGDTISADLLVTCNGERALVEVKSSQGPAPEDLMSKLEKHYQVWPKLRPSIEVHRGLLVVSHDLRTSPLARPEQPFQRREFVRAAPHGIVSTRQLLDWWLKDDSASIRELITGTHVPPVPAGAPPPEPNVDHGRKRWWRRK